MTGLREKWASSFYRGESRVRPLLLEEWHNIKLFVIVPHDTKSPKTKNELEHWINARAEDGGKYAISTFHPRERTYHVWEGDEWKYCAPNRQGAYDLFERLIKERMEVVE